MIKEKINNKLVNTVLILLIIFLLINTFGFWAKIVGKILSIIIPFIISFVIAYALFPFVKKLQNRNISKKLAVFIVVAVIVGFISLMIALLIPVMITQLSSLVNWLMVFIKNISIDYNVNLNFIQEYIGDVEGLINNYGKSISDFSFGLIMQSINFLSVFIICFIVCIYFLADMDKIRNNVKKLLKRKHKKTFNYISRIDHELSQYFVGLEKFIIIQFFEYTTIFFLIGHPYYLLLGILCSFTTVIPYFGGIFSNIVACLTAFFISKQLFILTLIVALVFPNIDGYIISPRIYGKTNNVPGLLTIFAVFAGGKLLGVAGIVIALPVTIIALATYRFYEDDISQKIDDIKKSIN